MNGYQHEALDRCHIIICNVADHLMEHPFTEQHEDVKVLIGEALEKLGDAYQLIGSKEGKK